MPLANSITKLNSRELYRQEEPFLKDRLSKMSTEELRQDLLASQELSQRLKMMAQMIQK